MVLLLPVAEPAASLQCCGYSGSTLRRGIIPVGGLKEGRSAGKLVLFCCVSLLKSSLRDA